MENNTENAPQPPKETFKFLQPITNLFKRDSTLSTTSTTNTDMDTTQSQTCRDKIKNKIEQSIQVEKSYTIFLVTLSIGLALLCMSLFFIPLIIFSPYKFGLCFAMGSLLVLASFLFFYGTKSYLSIICSDKRFYFTILFISSIILGIYFSITNSFLLSLLCAIFQLITLVVYTLSFVPGGQGGIKFIGSMLMAPINRLLGRSYLPI